MDWHKPKNAIINIAGDIRNVKLKLVHSVKDLLSNTLEYIFEMTCQTKTTCPGTSNIYTPRATISFVIFILAQLKWKRFYLEHFVVVCMGDIYGLVLLRRSIIVFEWLTIMCIDIYSVYTMVPVSRCPWFLTTLIVFKFYVANMHIHFAKESLAVITL